MGGKPIHGGEEDKGCFCNYRFPHIFFRTKPTFVFTPFVLCVHLYHFNFENYISTIITHFFCEKIYDKFSYSLNGVNSDEQYFNFMKWK